MHANATHFVLVDRKSKLSCATLRPADLEHLEQAFHRASWWRDRWRQPVFRAAALNSARSAGAGLVLIGPGAISEIPPAFDEFFEPIELHGGMGDRTDELKTLSGEHPTSQERVGSVLRWLGAIGGVALLAGGIFALRAGVPTQVIWLIGLGILLPLAIIGLASLAGGFGARWFLVPGGVAILRRPAKRGRPPRVTVFHRGNAVLTFRMVSTGKTSVLMMEIWTLAGKSPKIAVSEREAMSTIATWQSRQTPPADARLEGLVTW